MPPKFVGFLIEQSIVDDIDEIARANNVSRSEVMRAALEQGARAARGVGWHRFREGLWAAVGVGVSRPSEVCPSKPVRSVSSGAVVPVASGRRFDVVGVAAERPAHRRLGPAPAPAAAPAVSVGSSEVVEASGSDVDLPEAGGLLAWFEQTPARIDLVSETLGAVALTPATGTLYLPATTPTVLLADFQAAIEHSETTGAAGRRYDIADAIVTYAPPSLTPNTP